MNSERQIAASKAMRNAVMVMSRKAPGMLQVYMMLREVQVNDPKVTVRVGVSVGGPSIEYNPEFVLGMEPSMLGSIVYMNCLKVALHHFDKRKQEPIEMLKLASDIVVAEYARQVVDTSAGNNMEIVNRLFPSYWNYWPILSKHGFQPETDLVLEKIFEIFKEEYAQMQQQQQKDDKEKKEKEKKEKKDRSDSGKAKKKTSDKGGNDSDEGSEDSGRDGKAEQDSRPDGEDDGESGESPNGGKNGESTDDSNGNDGNDGGDNDDGTEGEGSSDDGGQGEGDSSPDESGNEGNGPGDSEGQPEEGDNSGDSEESDGDSEGSRGSGGDGASGEGQDGGSQGSPGGSSSGDTDGGDEEGDGSGDSESGDNGSPGGTGNGGMGGSGETDTPKDDFDRMAQYFSLTNAGSDLAKWDQDNVSRDKTTAIVQDALDKGMFDRMRGQLPLMLRNANRVKVNKESMFRRFMTSVTTDEATPSWSRRNRKFLHRGMIAPGYIYSDTQRILFCVDVSGSMQQGNAILNCLTVIENTLDGSSIDLVYWDAVCSPVFTTPRSIKDMAIYCGGRTNPECVMQKLGPEIKKYDGVIFLTDCIFDWKLPAYSKHIMILRTHGSAPFPSWCRYCEDLETFIGK